MSEVEIKQRLREIGEFLPYGSIKRLAIENGVKYWRAKDLFRERAKPRPDDHAFLMACKNLYLIEKQRQAEYL